MAKKVAECEVRLANLGDAKAVEVGVEYRNIGGLDANERMEDWVAVKTISRETTGNSIILLEGLRSGNYEVCAFAKHQLLMAYGNELKGRVP